MFGADNRLSMAVSEILRARQWDPMDEWATRSCSEVGPLILRGKERSVAETLVRYGFTPGTFNKTLWQRLVGEGGQASYRIHCLLAELEVPCCPECGAHLIETTHYTRAYGGGWDSFIRCAEACGYEEVCV
jgi:hypothetical protein